MHTALDVQVVRDIGDWIIDVLVAVGTLGAVVAAAAAAWVARADARQARLELAADRKGREDRAGRDLARTLAAYQARYVSIHVGWDEAAETAKVEGFLLNDGSFPVNAPTVRWLGPKGIGRIEQTYKTTLNPHQIGDEPMRFDLGIHPVTGLNSLTTRSVCVDFEDLQGTAWRVYPDRALRMRHAPDIDML